MDIGDIKNANFTILPSRKAIFILRMGGIIFAYHGGYYWGVSEASEALGGVILDRLPADLINFINLIGDSTYEVDMSTFSAEKYSGRYQYLAIPDVNYAPDIKFMSHSTFNAIREFAIERSGQLMVNMRDHGGVGSVMLSTFLRNKLDNQ